MFEKDGIVYESEKEHKLEEKSYSKQFNSPVDSHYHIFCFRCRSIIFHTDLRYRIQLFYG